MSMTNPVASSGSTGDGGEQEQDVTPLELFFDLVFVFAFTQVTGFLVEHLTWVGMIRGVALLAALWWAWVCYSWLTNAVPAEEILSARLVILAAMAAMSIVALTAPDAFGNDALLFGFAYFVVRVLHVILYAIATEAEAQEAVFRLAPGFLIGPALLIVAGFFGSLLQGGLWVMALAIDYGVAFVRGVAGFRVHAEHFVERHRLVVIVAFGESVVAIGVGAGELDLTGQVVFAALSGIVLVIALWWLYFDFVVLAAERNLAAVSGDERAALARDSYSYLHLPMITGIVFIALGIEQTLAHVGDPLGVIPAIALGGGSALYLLGHNAFRLRDTGTVSRLRFIVAAVAFVLIPAAVLLPAFVTLAVFTVLLSVLAAFETVRSEFRQQFRTS